jgi:CheY-like chemotaxis protein
MVTTGANVFCWFSIMTYSVKTGPSICGIHSGCQAICAGSSSLSGEMRRDLARSFFPQYMVVQPNNTPHFRERRMASRILVVDDEPMVRALIARALTDEGYEVRAVANGHAALDAARGAEVASMDASLSYRRTFPRSTSPSALQAFGSWLANSCRFPRPTTHGICQTLRSAPCEAPRPVHSSYCRIAS